MISSADISPCGRYRYSLTRIWNDIENPRIVCFAALNPSTANATVNDNTILREIAFGKTWGMDGLFKVNMYTWQETSPKKLFQAGENYDILGLSMEATVKLIVDRKCEFVVCGWGTNANKKYASRIASRGEQFRDYAAIYGLKLFCLGINQDGSPKHPLYLPPDTPLQPWGAR